MKNTEKDIKLEPLAIAEILDKKFFIPHYQRGYRWTTEQVQQLLDDVDSFTPRELPDDPDEKTFYCLQPIVVKKISDNKKNELKSKNIHLEGVWYEVIDGQQRLTSIYLIIQYINDLWAGRQKKDQFEIQYETREGCVDFLQSIKVNDDEVTVDINKENIDFYYISSAYKAIRDWELNYNNHNSSNLDDAIFQSKLLYNSKIIWYEVSGEHEDGRPLFERLNLGKIPLTNAELTKALFLSSESFKNLPKEEKKIKQIEIAMLWDEIEHKLNEVDKKLWSFITNKEREKYETKIELILDLISGKTDNEKDPLFTFLRFTQKQSANELSRVWQEIEYFYHTLIQWYLDKNYYHKIGYLVTARNCGDYNGIDLGELVSKSLKMPKNKFEQSINKLIQQTVKFELSELRYKNHYNQIFNILLLFNVETNRKSDAISEFYPFKQHKSSLWSIEHIHARKTENFDKTKREPWNKWLDMHKDLLEEFYSDKNREDDAIALVSSIETYNNDKLTWERFNTIFYDVNDFFTQDKEELDKESEGIPNLALLSQPDNSALNNSVFEVKRRAIIDLDKKGSFIPICTRRAFMKYFNNEDFNNQNFFWSKDDRTMYFKEIKSELEAYLPLNHIENIEDDQE